MDRNIREPDFEPEPRVSKKCVEKGCKKLSSYNYISQDKGLYCLNHKKENMINIRN